LKLKEYLETKSLIIHWREGKKTGLRGAKNFISAWDELYGLRPIPEHPRQYD